MYFILSLTALEDYFLVGLLVCFKWFETFTTLQEFAIMVVKVVAEQTLVIVVNDTSDSE